MKAPSTTKESDLFDEYMKKHPLVVKDIVEKTEAGRKQLATVKPGYTPGQTPKSPARTPRTTRTPKSPNTAEKGELTKRMKDLDKEMKSLQKTRSLLPSMEQLQDDLAKLRRDKGKALTDEDFLRKQSQGNDRNRKGQY